MVVILAIALALAGGVGVALAPLLERNRRLHSVGLAFTAGTLLSMILLHVMPEAMAHSEHAAIFLLVGFAAMMVLHQRGLDADPCCGHEHVRHAGLPSYLALCLCSVNDAVVMSSDVDSGFGSPLFWALAIHKATAAFALLMLLREVGTRRRRTLALYMLGFLLVTPLALVLAAQLHDAIDLWASALALSAGALLYVIAGSFVPRVEHMAREHVAPVLSTFLVAVLVSVGVELAAPHSTAHAQETPPAETPGR